MIDETINIDETANIDDPANIDETAEIDEPVNIDEADSIDEKANINETENLPTLSTVKSQPNSPHTSPMRSKRRDTQEINSCNCLNCRYIGSHRRANSEARTYNEENQKRTMIDGLNVFKPRVVSTTESPERDSNELINTEDIKNKRIPISKMLWAWDTQYVKSQNIKSPWLPSGMLSNQYQPYHLCYNCTIHMKMVSMRGYKSLEKLFSCDLSPEACNFKRECCLKNVTYKSTTDWPFKASEIIPENRVSITYPFNTVGEGTKSESGKRAAPKLNEKQHKYNTKKIKNKKNNTVSLVKSSSFDTIRNDMKRKSLILPILAPPKVDNKSNLKFLLERKCNQRVIAIDDDGVFYPGLVQTYVSDEECIVRFRNNGSVVNIPTILTLPLTDMRHNNMLFYGDSVLIKMINKKQICECWVPGRINGTILDTVDRGYHLKHRYTVQLYNNEEFTVRRRDILKINPIFYNNLTGYIMSKQGVLELHSINDEEIENELNKKVKDENLTTKPSPKTKDNIAQDSDQEKVTPTMMPNQSENIIPMENEQIDETDENVIKSTNCFQKIKDKYKKPVSHTKEPKQKPLNEKVKLAKTTPEKTGNQLINLPKNEIVKSKPPINKQNAVQPYSKEKNIKMPKPLPNQLQKKETKIKPQECKTKSKNQTSSKNEVLNKKKKKTVNKKVNSLIKSDSIPTKEQPSVSKPKAKVDDVNLISKKLTDVKELESDKKPEIEDNEVGLTSKKLTDVKELESDKKPEIEDNEVGLTSEKLTEFNEDLGSDKNPEIKDDKVGLTSEKLKDVDKELGSNEKLEMENDEVGLTLEVNKDLENDKGPEIKNDEINLKLENVVEINEEEPKILELSIHDNEDESSKESIPKKQTFFGKCLKICKKVKEEPLPHKSNINSIPDEHLIPSSQDINNEIVSSNINTIRIAEQQTQNADDEINKIEECQSHINNTTHEEFELIDQTGVNEIPEFSKDNNVTRDEIKIENIDKNNAINEPSIPTPESDSKLKQRSSAYVQAKLLMSFKANGSQNPESTSLQNIPLKTEDDTSVLYINKLGQQRAQSHESIFDTDGSIVVTHSVECISETNSQIHCTMNIKINDISQTLEIAKSVESDIQIISTSKPQIQNSEMLPNQNEDQKSKHSEE